MNLRRTFASAALAVAVIVPTGYALSASATLPPCIHEDGSGQESTGCYWDAQTMGNRLGTDHVVEPTLTYNTVSASYAWQMFDATNAASLLPYEGARVTYYGSNRENWILDYNTIVVSDDFGNHMLFLVG